MRSEKKIHPAKPILWIVFLVVMACPSWLPAQIGNPSPPAGAGGGTTINPTNNVLPVRTSATTFGDSNLTNGTNAVGITTVATTAPSYTVGTGVTQIGFGDDSAVFGPGSPTLWSNGSRRLTFNGQSVFIDGAPGLGCYKYASTINSTASTSLSLCQEAPSVLEVGSGGANEGGYTRDARQCRVTSDIALSTSPTSICTFSGLPATALPWQIHCDLLWSVTAGTTPTLTVGVNPSQTPAATTNVWAELKTTNTNTATELAVALSASGNTNILTTPTLTTAATIFSGTVTGNVSLPATAGTFAVTMTGAGTGFAGVTRAGTGCVFQ